MRHEKEQTLHSFSACLCFSLLAILLCFCTLVLGREHDGKELNII